MQYTLATRENDLIRGRARIGSIEIIVCTDGTSLFDGGAMFGVVPKTLWSKKVSADSQNRVAIGLNCVVVKTGGKTLLIETGFGNKLTPRLREIYGTQQLLLKSLEAAGISPSQIDIVINSHLHWDHCSWNTTLLPDGSIVPTFPNAQYIAHRGEVEHGRQQFERDRISYVADNYEPLIANGQMRLVDAKDFGADGRCPLVEGVSLQILPGHTEQVMGVHLESEGEHACFVSDLIPTSAHIEPTWAMGYDLDPLLTTEERKRFYQLAVPQKWLVLFPHDHQVPMTTLSLDERGKVIADQRRPEKVTKITAGRNEKPVLSQDEAEERRLAALYALELLDTVPEREFDEVVELAATICGTPTGLMSLVDRNRVFHKSMTGMDIVEVPRDQTFCQYTILEEELLVIEDASLDRRFDSNIFVQVEGGVRFYAGTPLRAPDGSAIGALCVVDTKPHKLTDEQTRALQILGKQIGMRLALRQREAMLTNALHDLEKSRESFRSFIDALPAEAYIKDANGAFIFYNKRLSERFSISQTEWLGKTSFDLWPHETAEHLAEEDQYVMRTGEPVEGNVELPNPDGTRSYWKIIKVRFKQGGIPMMAGVGIDLTAEQERQRNLEATTDELSIVNRRLQHLSVTDELTDLWNRRAFSIRIAEELAAASRTHAPLTLALIDLDDFKAINDTYGHPYGDGVLKKVADILRMNKRLEDIAVRYGGEEFALLLPRTDQGSAKIVCGRLLDALRRYPWERRQMSASIGIATFEDGESAESLAHRADVALYEAKRRGKDQAVTYSPAFE